MNNIKGEILIDLPNANYESNEKLLATLYVIIENRRVKKPVLSQVCPTTKGK